MLYSFMEKYLWLVKFGTTPVQANIVAPANSNREWIHVVFPHCGEQCPSSQFKIPCTAIYSLFYLDAWPYLPLVFWLTFHLAFKTVNWISVEANSLIMSKYRFKPTIFLQNKVLWFFRETLELPFCKPVILGFLCVDLVWGLGGGYSGWGYLGFGCISLCLKFCFFFDFSGNNSYSEVSGEKKAKKKKNPQHLTTSDPFCNMK